MVATELDGILIREGFIVGRKHVQEPRKTQTMSRADQWHKIREHIHPQKVIHRNYHSLNLYLSYDCCDLVDSGLELDSSHAS